MGSWHALMPALNMITSTSKPQGRAIRSPMEVDFTDGSHWFLVSVLLFIHLLEVCLPAYWNAQLAILQGKIGEISFGRVFPLDMPLLNNPPWCAFVKQTMSLTSWWNRTFTIHIISNIECKSTGFVCRSFGQSWTTPRFDPGRHTCCVCFSKQPYSKFLRHPRHPQHQIRTATFW